MKDVSPPPLISQPLRGRPESYADGTSSDTQFQFFWTSPSSRRVIGRIDPARLKGGLSLLPVLCSTATHHRKTSSCSLWLNSTKSVAKGKTTPVKLLKTLRSLIYFWVPARRLLTRLWTLYSTMALGRLQWTEVCIWSAGALVSSKSRLEPVGVS